MTTILSPQPSDLSKLVILIDETIKLVKEMNKGLMNDIKSVKSNKDFYLEDIYESLSDIEWYLIKINKMLIDYDENPKSIRELGGGDLSFIYGLRDMIHQIEELIKEKTDKESKRYKKIKLILKLSSIVKYESHKILFPDSSLTLL
jgi:hypothetical protein